MAKRVPRKTKRTPPGKDERTFGQAIFAALLGYVSLEVIARFGELLK